MSRGTHTMKPISNTRQAQYIISQRPCMRCSPTGLRVVVVKTAVLLKNWKMVMPLVRCAKGNNSTRNAATRLASPSVTTLSSKLTVGKCIITNIITCLIQKDNRYCQPRWLNVFCSSVTMHSDCPCNIATQQAGRADEVHLSAWKASDQ